MNRLIAIQQELKAPKGQYNSFGKYKYRNCEDILEAVKPLLDKNELVLILSDEVVPVDCGIEWLEECEGIKKHSIITKRVYIKATATLYDKTGKELIQTAAFAREEEQKKGMDASQITGASSSYARKYALNGLFAIDDTKDSDTTNTGKQKPKDKAQKEEPLKEGFIGAEEKDVLKKNIGTAAFAREMNACNGKMSFTKYYELLEETEVIPE